MTGPWMIGTAPPPGGRGRRRRLAPVLAAVCLVFAAGQGTPVGEAAAGEVTASGARIVSVTVYPDRAEVVREARVNLPAGESSVEFVDLPWQVEPDSLRVSARGVPATLGAVELRRKADEPKDSPEFIAAREEVRRIEAAIAALEAEEATSKQLREFVTSIQAATAKRESEKLAEGRADPASIQAVYALIRSSLGELASGQLERAQERRRLAEELKVARAKLAAARPAGAIRSRVATVEVVAQRAGALSLELAYLAPGASWRPSYRAVLDAASGEVSLVSEGVVRQSTGEDWSGVSLKLSTAAPARGVNPPELASWFLRPATPVAARGRMNAPPGVAGSIAMETDALQSAPAEPMMKEAFDQASEVSQASIVRSAYNVAFEVPGRSEVPADGRDHRVVLRQEKLEGDVEYRTVPALNPSAFLVARTTAPAGYPLLAGVVRVFAGGGYLGSFRLPETPPESKLTLPFGVDNRVTVERIRLPQERTREGFTGRERQIAFAFRTTLENLLDRKVRIVMDDRLPVSEDERIKVEVGKGTTPGYREDPDRPGVLQWTLDLAPRERREILIEYSVRFPKDLVVPGLG